MIEVYTGLLLLGIGYFLNKNRTEKVNVAREVNVQELNTNTNVYDSTFKKVAASTELNSATKNFNKHIAFQQKMLEKQSQEQKLSDNLVESSLTGLKVPISQFKHNNMTPFYKGSIKQNTNIHSNMPILETYTGNLNYYQPKQEVSPMFNPSKNVGNLYGNQVNTQRFQERMYTSQQQKNTLPFEQVRVGPGLNQGYSSEPTGGLTQFDARNYVMPKSTDELRVASKPKVTYEARIVDGRKGSNRGKIGQFDKNRVDTFYQNDSNRYLKTTGAYIKDKVRPAVEVKSTSRQETSRAYTGNAYNNKAVAERAAVQESSRTQLEGYDVGVASMQHMLNQARDDYGKGSILVYANERDVTSVQTHTGNFASIVKAIVAPIQDLLKTSKKEYYVEHPREKGQYQATMPSKMTVYDPNDIARTTIKETLLNETEKLNMKGAPKITVYDPNSIARTTIKETTLHDSQNLNLNGHKKAHVYDPNDIAKTTLKETTLHDGEKLNVKGGRAMGVVYDPDSVAKTTIRETTKPIATELNIDGPTKPHVYDPNDIARTTLKETLIDNDREYGNIDRQELQTGAYTTEKFDMPQTQKEVLSNKEYTGNPIDISSDGYRIVDAIPRETQKEHLSNKEYFGGAKEGEALKPMSYEDVYNATLNELREETLVGRTPTVSGTKIPNGKEVMNIDLKKNIYDDTDNFDNLNMDKLSNNPLGSKDIVLTKARNDYENIDRLDPIVLDSLKTNPFTQDINRR